MSNDTLHKAAFLGPKGENADEFERLLLEVLRDHVFWRRNFHPSDPRLIGERDKRTEAYDEMSARLRDELSQILAALKRAAPLYSPRQVAHIVSDPTLPALVGYFAGMLYNQNNVVAEVSPETVREEREYFRALAKMVGYPTFLPETLSPDARDRRTPYSWGHLCSGGTIANLEALWVARNVRLYPLAVRLVAETHDQFADVGSLQVTTATGERARLDALDTFRLSNLPTHVITDLHLRIKASLAEADRQFARDFQEALPSVRTSGLAAFLLRYNDAFPNDRARLPKVFISQATHYCWQKNMDLVGLGADALEKVPVDNGIRLDTDALADRLHRCIEERQPVLGVVSICGTTEEGAIDPMHEIEALRDAVADQGLSFWHHCDAAFGGFFASMLPKTDAGDFVPVADLPDDVAGGLLDDDSLRALTAIGETDSLTIDPHKFGFVPYPGGAVLFRDYHVRDAISYSAPYLSTDDTAGFGGFLGQWTLEGSRPGAAAVSCYLSQSMVPLTPEGHGQLLEGCIDTNLQLTGALKDRFSSPADALSLRPFHEPETVAFCFVVAPRTGIDHVDSLNRFTNRIWERMTVDGREDVNQYAFLVSKTEVSVANYAHVLDDMLAAEALEASIADGASLTLLRTCLMNPFQLDWQDAEPSFAAQFTDHLYSVALEEYLEHALSTVLAPTAERTPVLLLEPTPQRHDSLTRHVEQNEKAVAHFDVRSRSAAALRSGEEVPLDAASTVVLHVDTTAPAPMPQLAEHLCVERDVPPERILVLLTGADDPAPLRRRFKNLGLAESQILAEADRRLGVRRLVAHLYQRVRAPHAPARPTPPR
jgi:glutamate/tyrosine decarboxylase-like PLP-dependent enzyme